MRLAPLMRRRARAYVLLLTTIVSLASCGSVAAPPPSPVAVNACPPDSCASYVQSGGAACSQGLCVSNETLDFTLVVSTSAIESSMASIEDPASVTLTIPRFVSTYLRANACRGDLTCASMPLAVLTSGTLTVDGATQVCAGRPDTDGTALSATVEYRPLWSLVSAPTVGLPLVPVPAGPDPLNNAPATEWSARFGPSVRFGPSSTPALEYEEDIVPVDPNYPPVRLTAAFQGGGQAQSVALNVDECSGGKVSGLSSFMVTRGNGTFGGFTAYIADAVTLERVSSLAALTDTPNAPVTLLTSGVLLPSGWKSGYDIVIAPPAGAPIPIYADTIAPVAQLGQVNFPPLPAPLTVSGSVLGPSGEPIDADLVLQSTQPSATSAAGGITVCANADCSSPAPGSTQRPLSFATTAHATRSSGYSVVLPPGDYSVFVLPALGEAAGATATSLNLQLALPGVPPVAEGKTLVAGALGTIEGAVTLADGRPLVGAEVEAHVAASVVALGGDPRLWPRTVGTLTDENGGFLLAGDPGTYDIVVRPIEGTGFPWMTVTSQAVSAGSVLSFPLPMSALVVPAPIFVDMTLQDGEGVALAGAVVSAYAPVLNAGSVPQIQLGAWLTDAAGHFTMDLAPPR